MKETPQDDGYVFEDYSTLIPSDPDNLKSEIPHDDPAVEKNDEIEFLDI